MIEEVKNFLSKPSLAEERYSRIRKIWRKATESQRLFFAEELDNSSTWFEDPVKFKEFSLALALQIGISSEWVNSQVIHEIQHSIPYYDVNVRVKFGWFKIFHREKGTGFLPFMEPFGEKYDSLPTIKKDILKYKSLNSVSELSLGDLLQIQELENIYGEDIKKLSL